MPDYRADFADFEGVAYLNCANQGPFPRVAVAAIQEAIALKARPDRIRDDIYFRLPAEVRSELGGLLGAPADSFAITNGASDGIFAVARGLEWRSGDQVLVAAGDFPNFHSWAQLADRGVELRVAQPEGLVKALTARTRAVSVSWVNYNTGFRLDLAALGRACRDNGTLPVVDFSQAAGALDFRLDDLPVDVAVGCGYKWLLSPYGTGFAYFRPEVLERLRVTDIYWQALEGAEDFNRLPREGWRLAGGARRFDSVETASYLNLFAMRASLRFLRRVGTEEVERHATALLDCLRELLPAGFRVAGPPDRRYRSTVMALEAENPALTRRAFERALAAGVVVSLREDRIRVSPNVYNTTTDVERLARALA